MKKLFVIMSLVLAMSLVIGLAPRDAKAQTCFDLAFDGFIDGMTLCYGPGAMVYGVRTGTTPDPLIGDYAYVFTPTVGILNTVTIAPNQFIFNYYIAFDLTWSNYYTDGSFEPFLLNSGTWSVGVPAAAGGGSASTDLD
jgi:hypothetical protein